MSLIRRSSAVAGLFLLLLAVVPLQPIWAGSGTFQDDDGSIHEPSIEALAEAGVTDGCAEDLYCPERPVTRAQLASLVDRAFDIPNTQRDAFDDDEKSVHERSINAVARAGIVSGCTPDDFCPDRPVTRAQAASFIARAMDLPPGPDAFSDDDSSVHEGAINSIAAEGIATGCGGGKYCPDAPMNRGQVASFLARALGLETSVDAGEGSAVFVADNANRVGAVQLDGATVAGNVYVFVSTSLNNVEEVRFFVNGDFYRAEQAAPYDLAGGSVSVANAFDSDDLGDGQHTVRAVIKRSEGDERITVRFDVDGSGSPSTAPPTTQPPGTTPPTTQPPGTTPPTTQPPATTTTTQPPATTTTTQPPVTTTQPPATTTTTQPSGGGGGNPPAGAVVVRPGESIQSAVNQAGEGGSVWIKAGVHVRQSVSPKAGQTIAGENGAVLDGKSSTQYAFKSGNPNVTIRNLEIKNYDPPNKDGAIQWSGGAKNWVVEDNDVHHNGYAGIKVNDGWIVRNNHVHHNAEFGVKGSGNNVLIVGNEIAFNNTSGKGGNGATKFVNTRNITIRNNYVHDNDGVGIWTDINNIDVLVENNTVDDNDGPGIKQEIGYDAVIRNNTVRRNGFGRGEKVSGAGILVNTSPNVEIYGNTLVGNNYGIMGKEQDRSATPGTPAHGPWQLKNMWVHDNVIKNSARQTGVHAEVNKSQVFGSWNNRFDRNTYQLGGGSDHYRWDGSKISRQQWQNAGQDTNGNWQ